MSVVAFLSLGANVGDAVERDRAMGGAGSVVKDGDHLFAVVFSQKTLCVKCGNNGILTVAESLNRMRSIRKDIDRVSAEVSNIQIQLSKCLNAFYSQPL